MLTIREFVRNILKKTILRERDLKHELLNLPESSLRLKLKPGSMSTQNLPGQISNSTSATDNEQGEKREQLQEQQIVLDKECRRCADSKIGGGDIYLIVADNNNNQNNSSRCMTCDVGVNTDNNTQKDVATALRSKIATLENEIEGLKKKEALLNKLLSPAQQRKLSGVRSLKWTVGDISKAITMYSAKRWVKKISISPGILKSIFFPILNHPLSTPSTSAIADNQDFEEFNNLVYDSLEYLGGYICK